MILGELRNAYLEILEGLYPVGEIQEIFYLLTEEWLALRRHEVVLNMNMLLDPADSRKFIEALSRLKRSEPVQYVLGYSSFCGLDLSLNPDVLVPRPETEEMVDWVSHYISVCPAGKILDIGTGSGCIALALKHRFPDRGVEGMEISPAALRVATHNKQKLGLDVRFFQLDALGQWGLEREYSLVISNPPYVTTSERSLMHKNVLRFEPSGALFVSDEDPLAYYKAIGRQSLNVLRENGMLVFEINERFGIAMVKMLEGLGYLDVELKKDFLGKDRFIRARYGVAG